MCHQPLLDDKAGAGRHLCDRAPVRGVNALDLDHLHLHVAPLFHVDFRDRVQNPLAGSVAFAVVLLDIFDLGVLSDIEAVDAVVFGVHAAAVADAAAGDDDHVAVLTYIEVVVNYVVQAALAHDDGDMNALVPGAGLDTDINSGAVLFGDDLDVGRARASGELSVASDIKGSLGN